ncbi:MAG: glycosyltransferase family 2 protein [Schwartzia sp. (in: firmicutes)]
MVSIIIPAYNRADCLSFSLESALQQTYEDIEVILVDDGSIDDTASRVRDFQKRYGQKVKYIYQKNQGVSAARNRGLQEASGEYVTFLDSDDRLYPTKIEEQVKFLREQEADVCCCNYWVLQDGCRRQGLCDNGRISLLAYLQNRMTPQTNAWLMKRERLRAYHLSFREGCAWGEDMEFFVKVLYTAKKIVFLPQLLFEYRIHDGALSSFSWDKLEQDVFIWNEIWAWLRQCVTDQEELIAYEKAIFGYRLPALLIYRLWKGRSSRRTAKMFADHYQAYLVKRDWSNGLRSLKLAFLWQLFKLNMLGERSRPS